MAEALARDDGMRAVAMRSQRLETIGLLAAGLVHDFRNVLTVVSSTLSLLDRKEMDERMRHVLIVETGRSLEKGKDLAKRLLSLSRQDEAICERVCIDGLLGELRTFIAAALGPDIALDIDCPAGLPKVRADRSRLELALLNLVTNAKDAMPKGGALRITSELVQSCSAGVPTDYIHLTVSDTGLGMDEVTLTRATDLFFTTKDRQAGTGIGLWLVRSFLEEMGGNFTLTSSPGRGTSAELWLPALDNRPLPEPPFFIIPQL
jgi:signal transduction histidine kinase